jgi:glycine betaine/proline transport system ATP-binding protein
MSSSKKVKISLQGLSKVFGNKAQAMLPYLEQGIDRAAMLAKYNHVLALNNITMDLHENSIEVIMGLSGSGKSTLIRHINRLIEPTAGKIIVDNEDVCQFNKSQLSDYRRQKTAMVFQNFALLPHRNIIDNIAFGLKVQGKKEAFIKEMSNYWLERVGLQGFAQKYPAQLSGGMQQRVGLARALACDADILMLDEAFSALDPLIRADMQDMLLMLQQELHKTIVFITHDLDEALKLGDRIAILNQGQLIQQGNAQSILMHPANDYVQKFAADVSRVNILKVKAVMSKTIPALTNQKIIHVREEDTIKSVLHDFLSADAQYALVLGADGQAKGCIDAGKLAQIVNQ